MNQTVNNLINTNRTLRIADQDFSNEVIFEEVLTDSEFGQINLLYRDFQDTDFYYTEILIIFILLCPGSVCLI